MKTSISSMTHPELCDDVKASINSLIEDKVNDPDPYTWHLPPKLILPDGPPIHRRMPRKVHKWSIEELRLWKRALDRGEVKLLTPTDRKNEVNKQRREKKESVRKAASKKVVTPNSNVSVVIMSPSSAVRSRKRDRDVSVEITGSSSAVRSKSRDRSVEIMGSSRDEKSKKRDHGVEITGASSVTKSKKHERTVDLTGDPSITRADKRVVTIEDSVVDASDSEVFNMKDHKKNVRQATEVIVTPKVRKSSSNLQTNPATKGLQPSTFVIDRNTLAALMINPTTKDLQSSFSQIDRKPSAKRQINSTTKTLLPSTEHKSSVKLQAESNINLQPSSPKIELGRSNTQSQEPTQVTYEFDDFFTSQPPPTKQAPSPNPINEESSPKMVRLERTALAREFEQKIDQIFGVFTDDPLTEEDWAHEVLKLSKDVTRHQVDLRGELDVLRTTAKGLYVLYNKRIGGKAQPYTESKLCESIEFVQGVLTNLLYSGAGLAVEDALKVVKLKYQERLQTLREQHDEGGCEFARTAKIESSRLKEDHLNALKTLREEHDEGGCELARAAKEENARLEQDFHNSLTKLGEQIRQIDALSAERASAKRASKKTEIKDLKKQRKELMKQLKDKNTQVERAIQLDEELTQELEMAREEILQIRDFKAKIEDQEAEIKSLYSQLTKKESMRSSGSYDQKDSKKSRHSSRQTLAAAEASSVAFSTRSSDLMKQQTSTESSKQIHMEEKAPSSSSTQPSPSAQLIPGYNKRKRSTSIAMMPNPDSTATVSGVSDTPNLTSRKPRERNSKTNKRKTQRKSNKNQAKFAATSVVGGKGSGIQI